MQHFFFFFFGLGCDPNVCGNWLFWPNMEREGCKGRGVTNFPLTHTPFSMLFELVDFSLILVSNQVYNALSTPLFCYKSMLVVSRGVCPA